MNLYLECMNALLIICLCTQKWQQYQNLPWDILDSKYKEMLEGPAKKTFSLVRPKHIKVFISSGRSLSTAAGHEGTAFVDHMSNNAQSRSAVVHLYCSLLESQERPPVDKLYLRLLFFVQAILRMTLLLLFWMPNFYQNFHKIGSCYDLKKSRSFIPNYSWMKLFIFHIL